MPPARQAAVRNSEKRSLFVFAGDTPANTHPGHDEGVLARVRAVTATERPGCPTNLGAARTFDPVSVLVSVRMGSTCFRCCLYRFDQQFCDTRK
jgi:hypothetical protein